MRMFILLLCIPFTAFQQAPSEKDVLKKLVGYKWFITSYTLDGEPLDIPEESQEHYWFTFQDDGNYIAVFEGEAGMAKWNYEHEKGTITMTYETGEDVINLESISATEMKFTGDIYGEGGYMLFKRWE